MSLQDRVKDFLRVFPTAHMKVCTLREVYRQHGIKRKKFKWYKQPVDQDPDKARRLLATLRRKLTMAKNDGYRVIYADETMVTRKTVPDLEWSRPKENPTVD